MARHRTFGLPVQVVLRGEPSGWHCVIVDASGAAEQIELSSTGTRWPAPSRHNQEPAWWPAQLAETAARLRRHIEDVVTDRCFALCGAEGVLSWNAGATPALWEGTVTLSAPDPARTPGQVPPFVVTLEPGQGALLSGTHLRLRDPAANAWHALAVAARQCAAAAPHPQFVCGWADHRIVRVGRGFIAVSTSHNGDGEQLVAEIYGERSDGWAGNPGLRVQLEGTDLLHEPSGDVLWILKELGYKVIRHGATWQLPAAGVTLYQSASTARDGNRSPFRAAALGIVGAEHR